MSGEFVATIGGIQDLPKLLRGEFLNGRREPRIAFVGRSNVGKSSLLNSLLGTTLARTSNQPGKTRGLHFYLWKEAKRILVDLPGYGYARAGHEERERWAEFINQYLKQDPLLDAVLVLLDS